MQIRKTKISIAVLCLVLGIMLAVVFQSTRYYNAAKVPERAEDLLIQIKIAMKEKVSLEQKSILLSKQLTNTENNAQVLTDLQKEFEITNLTVGLVPVEGPGIKIIVSDNPKDLATGDNPNSYLVHDEHLLLITNELKAAGAEAISINNQRITAMSEIRCAGTLINVNGIAIGPPFTLQAIGDPDLLYSTIIAKNGELEYLNASGLKTSVVKMESMTLPAALKRTLKIDLGKPALQKQIFKEQ